MDIIMALGPLFSSEKYEEVIAGVIEKAKPKLELLKKFIGNKQFAMGYLTITDFKIAQTSYYIEKISPDVFKEYEFLGRIR